MGALLVGGWPGAGREVEPDARPACCAACAGPPGRSAGLVMPVAFSTRFRRSTAADLEGMSDLALYQRMTDLQEMDFARSTAPAVIAEYRAELTAVRQELTRREVAESGPAPDPEPGGSGPRPEPVEPEPVRRREASGSSSSGGAGLLLVAGLLGLAMLAK
jgi:hypothetical protein